MWCHDWSFLPPFFSCERKKKDTQLKSKGDIHVKTCIFFIFIHGAACNSKTSSCKTSVVDSACSSSLIFLAFNLFSLLLSSINQVHINVSSPLYTTLTRAHMLHHCVFSGHLTRSAISDLRGVILWLITLTQGCVCAAACWGSWLEAGTGSN